MEPKDDIKFMRRAAVLSRIGIGKSKMYQLILAGEFPKPIRIDGVAVWVESEVRAWQAEKMQG